MSILRMCKFPYCACANQRTNPIQVSGNTVFEKSKRPESVTENVKTIFFEIPSSFKQENSLPLRNAYKKSS